MKVCASRLVFLPILLLCSSILLSQANDAANGGLHASIRVRPQPLHAGDHPTTTAVIYGGSPPYQYSWFDGARLSSSASANVYWAGVSSGSHTFKLVVTDSAGHTVQAQIAITYDTAAEEPPRSAAVAAPAALTVAILPAEIEVTSGGSTQTIADVSGGTPPYTYEWHNGDQVSKVTGGGIIWSNLNRPGRRDLRLVVHDSAGALAEAHAVIVVVAPQSTSESSSPGTQQPAINPGEKSADAVIEDNRKAGESELARIAPIKISDECTARLADAPWGGDVKGSPGLVKIEPYRTSVAHALRNLHIVYGNLTPAQSAALDKLWAPFYNSPNPAAATWFANLNPLLDDYIATASALEANFPDFQESMGNVIVALGTRSAGLYRVSASSAVEEYKAIDTARKHLADLTKQIAALGDAPNPLATECAARSRHRKAMGEEDVLALLLKQTRIYVNAYTHLDTVSDGVAEPSNGVVVSWRWDQNALKSSEELNNQYFNYASPCSQPSNSASASRVEIQAEAAADGRSIQHLLLTNLAKGCDYKTHTVIGPSLEWSVELVNIPLTKVEHGPNNATQLTYSVTGSDVASHIVKMAKPIHYDHCEPDNIKIQFSSGGGLTAQDIDKIAAVVSGSVAKFNSPGCSGSPAQQAPQAQAAAATSASPSPQVDTEAIDLHTAIAKQYEASATRWEVDAKNETDPVRHAELLRRALDDRANASAERDLASSIRTGEYVHSRTEWDQQQHDRLVTQIKDELWQFGAAKRQAKADELKKLQAEQKAAQEELGTVEEELEAAEMVQKAATTAITVGAIVVPGAGEIAMAYSVGTGYIEGGPSTAIATAARMYSPYIDAGASFVEGWQQIDPKTGKQGDLGGALEAMGMNLITNKVMGTLSEHIQGAVAHVDPEAPKTADVAKEPIELEAFKTNEARYEESRAKAKTPEEAAVIDKQYDTIQQRQQIKQKIDTAVSDADAMAAKLRRPDGTVDTSSKEYQAIVEQLSRTTEKIQSDAGMQENRDLIHQEALNSAGLAENDVFLSGGKPRNALSDMDVTARTFAAGNAYAKALRAKGLKVTEFGDRWVVSNDTTIWKPAAADAIGTGSYEAQVIHGASAGSDKFATQSGQNYTKGQEVGDQLGAVVDNFKKAGEAGLTGGKKPDLHVIGKSADKVMGIVNQNAQPELRSQLQALRAHRPPEQAGVVTLGASPEVKAREMDAFLKNTRNAMGEAYRTAAQSSVALEASLVQQKQTALSSGDIKRASNIQRQLAIIRTDNRLALATVSESNPGLLNTLPVPDYTIPPPANLPSRPAMGWSPLLKELTDDRNGEGKNTLQPNVADPAFKGLPERMKSAASTLDAKLRTAKPGSDEAKYLAELKSLLVQGQSNPVFAVQQARPLTGYELPEVLSQLSGPSGK